jgi:hypothetical protein
VKPFQHGDRFRFGIYKSGVRPKGSVITHQHANYATQPPQRAVKKEPDQQNHRRKKCKHSAVGDEVQQREKKEIQGSVPACARSLGIPVGKGSGEKPTILREMMVFTNKSAQTGQFRRWEAQSH